MFTKNQRSKAMKTLMLVLALVLTFSSLGLAVSPARAAGNAQVENCARWHTVQRGEYLVMIARMYDTDWRTIAEINNLKNPALIYAGNRLCVEVSGKDQPGIPNTGNQQTPVFDVVAVRAGRSVTIEAEDFPRNLRFNVLMGKIGTQAEDGILVDRISSGDGDFVKTFDIPSSLANDSRIAIRLESTSTAHFSYSWFNNRNFGNTPDENDDNDEDLVYDPVAIPDEAKDDILETEAVLNPGEATDVYLGSAGVFLPSSAYNGTMEMRRIDPRYTDPELDLEFVQNLLQYRAVDASGRAYPRVIGLNYVYFNLTRETFRDWKAGDLGIYTYDVQKAEWVPCETQLHIGTVNEPYGRLACIPSSFGYFGLALDY